MLVFAGHRRVRRDVGSKGLAIWRTVARGWLVDLTVAVVVAPIAAFATIGAARFVIVVAVFTTKTQPLA